MRSEIIRAILSGFHGVRCALLRLRLDNRAQAVSAVRVRDVMVNKSYTRPPLKRGAADMVFAVFMVFQRAPKRFGLNKDEQ